MTAIYTVTVFEKTKKSCNVTTEKRTWGWMPTQAEAEKWMLENWCDAFEGGWYEFGVVEKVEAGFCVAKDVAWFKASLTEDSEDVTVARCDPPEWATQICNWAMG